MSKITENVNEAPGNNSKDETWQMTVENFDEENEIASRGMMTTSKENFSFFSSIKLHNDLFPHREITHYSN